MRKAHLLAALALPLGLAVACQSQTVGQPLLVRQETSAIFQEGERKVIKPLGREWITYYYKNETVESLATKVASAEFFVAEGWRPFHHLKKTNVMVSSRGKQPAGELSSIQITAGKDYSDPSGVVSTEGATMTLIPSSGK
jgi:hypothetical protein